MTLKINDKKGGKYILIPNQYVEVKWCASNLEWYKTKGYNYTKLGNVLLVKAEDLPTTSKHKVKIRCDWCGKEYETTYFRHCKCLDNGDACHSCLPTKNKTIFQKRYGVDTPFQSDIAKEKSKQTCLKKYGKERACQSDEVKAKIAQTNLEKYGNSMPLLTEAIKGKAEKTLKDKYGVTNAFASKEIQKKIQMTNKTKYGEGNIAHTPSISEKIRKTNMEKYGVPYTTQSVEVQRKMRETFYRKGKCNSSKEEEALIESLIRIYGKDACFPSYPLDKINMDCLLCIGKDRIDIEYDGWYWHKNTKERDKRRNYYVLNQGYKVLRFVSKGTIPSDEEIIKYVDYLVKDNHHIKIVEIDT